MAANEARTTENGRPTSLGGRFAEKEDYDEALIHKVSCRVCELFTQNDSQPDRPARACLLAS